MIQVRVKIRRLLLSIIITLLSAGQGLFYAWFFYPLDALQTLTVMLLCLLFAHVGSYAINTFLPEQSNDNRYTSGATSQGLLARRIEVNQRGYSEACKRAYERAAAQN